MSDHGSDRKPIPAAIIARFSEVDSLEDYEELVESGYLDAMLESGHVTEESIQAFKALQNDSAYVTKNFPILSIMSNVNKWLGAGDSTNRGSYSISELLKPTETLPQKIAKIEAQRKLEKQQEQQRYERENPPIPESKFKDVNGKYAELLRVADKNFREEFEVQVSMKLLFISMPGLCPKLVEKLDGKVPNAKLILVGDDPLHWDQFRDNHFKRHFPDLV